MVDLTIRLSNFRDVPADVRKLYTGVDEPKWVLATPAKASLPGALRSFAERWRSRTLRATRFYFGMSAPSEAASLLERLSSGV